jgi:hypothetical protein
MTSLWWEIHKDTYMLDGSHKWSLWQCDDYEGSRGYTLVRRSRFKWVCTLQKWLIEHG